MWMPSVLNASSRQGIQLVEDSLCNLCGSSGHLGDECDFIAIKSSAQVAFEEALVGIHRSIVHRVYVLASDLYHLHYPRFFYPGQTVKTLASSEASLLPVPLIGLAQAVASLLSSSSAHNYLLASFLSQRSLIDSVARITVRLSFSITPLSETPFKNVSRRNSTKK